MFIPNPIKSRAENTRAGLKQRPLAKAYKGYFTAPTLDAYVDILVQGSLAASIAGNATYNAMFVGADALIQTENTNGISAGQRIAQLAADMQGQQLGPRLNGGGGANILPLGNYGALPGDSDELKAAKWLVNSSNTLTPAHVPNAQAALHLAVHGGVQLDTVAGLMLLNQALDLGGGGAGAPAFRGTAFPPGKIPASATGAWLLSVSLGIVHTALAGGAPPWQDLALYMLGMLIRSHGFTDGNGRTARGSYAVMMLRGGVAWAAPTNAFEQTLHQL